MSEQTRKDLVRLSGSDEEPRADPAPVKSHKHGEISRQARERSESGEPGGGSGRRDEVGPTGVYPYSSDERPTGDAGLRRIGEWAGGDRGIAGYEDSGGSELFMREGELLGGLTSDPSGRPTIDIHGGDAGRQEAEEAKRKRRPKGRGRRSR